MDMAARSVVSIASAEANGLRVGLVRDIQGFQLAMHEANLLNSLRASKPVTSATRQRLDAQWADLPDGDADVRAVLENPISEQLRFMRQSDSRISGVLITNRHGDVVAADQRTVDFFQGNEDWFLQTRNEGQGRIVIPPVYFDPSLGTHVMALCLPILDDREFLGVVKVKMDIQKWVLQTTGTVGVSTARPMLVRQADGVMVFRDGVVPTEAQVLDWGGGIADGTSSGWRVAAGELQAYVPMPFDHKIAELETQMPDWTLVMYVSEEQLLWPVYRFIIYASATALMLLVVVFVSGLYMIDRLVVRRLRRLQWLTHRVFGGDLTVRVEQQEVLGSDEIDSLARDFNDMVGRVQRSHNELLAANELKTNFIQIAGHELRTPVSYMLGMMKLLKECRDPDRLMQALQSIASKAKRLDDIIHAMFKLMPGQLYNRSLRYENVSLSVLMEEIYLECHPFIEKRNQRLLVEISPQVKDVRADREKLRDIILNLLTNAVKFTPDQGTIVVTINPELNAYVSIAVQDQGPGIPEAELPRLFQPFYAGGDVLKHSSGETGYQKRGIGLGLAIVRHFVELHGGTVNVSSSPAGSTFTVLLPIGPPRAAQQGPGIAEGI